MFERIIQGPRDRGAYAVQLNQGTSQAILYSVLAKLPSASGSRVEGWRKNISSVRNRTVRFQNNIADGLVTRNSISLNQNQNLINPNQNSFPQLTQERSFVDFSIKTSGVQSQSVPKIESLIKNVAKRAYNQSAL